jgi:hypothetical protein
VRLGANVVIFIGMFNKYHYACTSTRFFIAEVAWTRCFGALLPDLGAGWVVGVTPLPNASGRIIIHAAHSPI